MKIAPRLPRLLGSFSMATLPLLGGCATMFNGTSQTIPVTSTPSGQRVAVDGHEVGVTPINVRLDKTGSHIIAIGADSAPHLVYMNRRVSAWIVADLFWLYGLPMLLDFGTGGAFHFSQDRVHALLPEANGDSASWVMPDARIRIATDAGYDEARAEWARGDSVAWHWPASHGGDGAARPAQAASLSDKRVQVHVGRDRSNGGRTGVKVVAALTTLGPLVIGAMQHDAFTAAFGTTMGVYLFPFTLPLGYAIGAASARERWSPASAYRGGVDLAEGDLVRLGDERTFHPVQGRVRDIVGDTLLLSVNRELRRYTRGSTQLQRARGSDWKTGFRYGAIIGGSLAMAGQSMCKCKMRQRDMVLIPLSGAILGAWISPALAPRRWVNVAGW